MPQNTKTVSKYATLRRKSRSGSSSGSSSRRPSLTRKRSSQRLIRTISVETEMSNLSVLDSDDTNAGPVSDLDGQNVGNEHSRPQSATDTDGSSVLPALSSIKISSNGPSGSIFESIAVPFIKASLDTSLPDDYLREDILNMIQSLKIPRWYRRGAAKPSCDSSKMELVKIKGAMTNAIFKISYPHLPSLLLRAYGKNNSSIIDREYELAILARLSARNIGPSLYGCFDNGRFEQFLENATTLTRDDIRDWKTSQRIARRMKELHSGVPLLTAEMNGGASCWKKIDKWIKLIDSHPGWTSVDRNIQSFLKCQNWVTFKDTVEKYRSWLFSKYDAHIPLVFCHNDAQYGNLLFSAPVINTDFISPAGSISSITRASSSASLFPSDSNVFLDKIINPTTQEQIQDKKLVVIDFEYAGANPAAYDLANHLTEWMYNYSGSEPWKCSEEHFPTKEQFLNFLYSYVSHLKGVAQKTANKEIDKEVRYYYNEILRWRATVQLFWCLWAIIQCGQLGQEALSGNDGTEEQEGINGEKYIITIDDTDTKESSPQGNLDGESEGVDIETFDYTMYSADKISVFWGDLIQSSIVSESACFSPQDVKYLNNNPI
ncbi:bifunctional choline kinase/ethanolamine kinase CKI1 KNAG_0G02490 [Huiozyma naganishii CBS 8797]|uniref:Choline kinase N-terminal domain-containing protein n=1 Tax=Huiozyma naganishii (strain ATCC MYA-139 / BCRC 22969 / CBS 8797 / KCTC 17520 / NBRC 10181 / NCYC 3082 / Yp74L-3) TaxID=1071383 RepID=J7S946_HUIN7|nr:hypothetical protein KNAG_0G02490 [Kazachstania naganishii CBS 8797]CCK71306.1 hypothetical protein KNAG_0G02490 [Kazachstania naganishii CBS 8797]